jgi:hypothetical protein
MATDTLWRSVTLIAITRQPWLRERASIVHLYVRCVLFQVPYLSSFPLDQMLTHDMTVVCGLCDLTIATALRQATSRFLQCPLSQSRMSTTFFLGSKNLSIQVFQAGDKQATFRIPSL